MERKRDRKEELLRSLVSGRISTAELVELKEKLQEDARARRIDALASALIIARIDVLLYDHKMLSESLMKIEDARNLERKKEKDSE